jgi:ABC-type glycerol-3-phosphate transport system substrate-binding protein
MQGSRVAQGAARLTRRALARYGALSAGAGAVLGTLVPRGALAAGLTGSGGEVQVMFQSNWQGSSWNQTAVQLCQHFVDSTFNSNPQYRGIRAVVSPTNGQGQASAVISAVLSGASGIPDIVESCCSDFPTYQGANLLTPLNPNLSTDNIDPYKLFVRGHVEALSVNGTVYGLPSYDAPPTMYYRQDILDQLGLAYPSPDWTYVEAEQIWRSVASLKTNNIRHGVTLYTGTEMEYLLKGWGTSEMDATHTTCLLGDPQAIAAGEWLYGLLLDNVAGYRTDSGGLFGNTPATVFAMSGGWSLLPAAENLRGVKWDILPNPRWQTGESTTFDNIDFYALLRSSKHPNEAWEFMRWLTTEPDYNLFLMKVNLIGPALLSLWDQYETIITAAAPPLRGKSLQYIKEAALSGRAYPHLFFAEGPLQADGILNTWMGKIGSRQVSVAEGFTQTAAQINAWEKQAGKFFAAEAAALHKIEAVQPGPHTNYAPPSVSGVGVPVTPTPYILEHNGTFTMLGDGQDCYSASDNTTFACIPVTATEGEWWCRVVSVTNLTCPHLSQWAKVGIMARGDLSDDAPDAYVHVTGAHQIEWQARLQPGLTPGGQSGLTPNPNNSGNLMLPNTKPAANYLIKPLWLKLSRKGMTWTAWSSFDGQHWVQTGSPQTVEMGGCWIGIQACSHNGSFNNKGYIRAVIDNVSFKPTRFVQVGQIGVPPNGGPVPKNWATA